MIHTASTCPFNGDRCVGIRNVVMQKAIALFQSRYQILACIREYFVSLPDGQEIEEVLARAIEKAQERPIFGVLLL